MAILFADGFDGHATTEDAIKKAGSGTGFSILTTGVRTGAQCLRFANNYMLSRSIPPVATVGVSAAIRLNSEQNQTILFRFNSLGTAYPHIGVIITPGGRVAIKRGGAAIGFAYQGIAPLGTSSAAMALNVWNHIEVKVYVHDTLGTVTVKLNGQTILDLTGVDTRNGTSDMVDAIHLFGESEGQLNCDLDDLIIWDATGAVNNDFLGDCKVEMIRPIGNGANSGLTGSDGNAVDNYLLVDETLASATDYVGSAVDGAKDTYVMSDLVASSGTIKAVQATPYVAKSDAGVRAFCPVYRHAGVDYDGADIPLTTTYLAVTQVREVNPGTGVAWTVADVNALEAGIKVRP